MKFKKLIISLLVCVLLSNTLSALALAAVESDVFTISGVDCEAEIGAQARVDLLIENNPGFSAINLSYTYDETYFTLVSVKNASPMTMTHDKTTVWDIAGEYHKDGVLATLIFDVAKNTPFGKYEIGIELISAANANLEHVTPMTVNATVLVTPIRVKGVSLYNPDLMVLDVGATEQLVATVWPEEAADKTVIWHSDNTAVASVDSNGVVTGVGYGTTNITVTTNDGGYTATCEVSVNCPHHFISKVIAPTYLEHGYTLYTCDICGHSYQEDFVDPLERIPLDQAQLTLEYTSAYYKGEPLEPAVFLSYQQQELNAQAELKVTYNNNNRVGTATVTVEGINQFVGSVTIPFTISYETIPQKIVNVSAVADFGKILLSWGRSSEVMTDRYRIYRMAEGEEEYSLLHTIVGRDTVTYEDCAVEKDVAYTYYVTGVGEYGAESEPSNVAGAIPLVDLTAPTVLKISPSEQTILSGSMTFSAIAEDNVGVVKGTYFYSLNGTDWNRMGSTSNENLSLSFKFDFSTDVTAVQIRLIVYDAQGNASEPKIAKYVVDTKGPDQVTGLTAIPLSSKLTLSWNDVQATDAQYFVLEQQTQNGWKRVATNITTLGYTVTGLLPATAYCFRVVCVDVRGNIGEYSEEFNCQTAADTTAPVITEQGPASNRYNHQIQYYATARDDSGIQSIAIQVSHDLSKWTEIARKEFTGVDSKQNYSYVVDLSGYADGNLYLRAIAQDFSGNISNTDSSAPYSEYIVDRTAPSCPENVSASGKNGYVSIFWAMGKELDIDTYSVYRAQVSDGEYQLIASSLSAVSYHDTMVEEGKTYYYKIAVVDKAGNISEYSAVVSAEMIADTQMPEIVGIGTTSSGKISASIHTINVSALDNNNLSSLLVEYCTNRDLEYKTLFFQDNLQSAYINRQITLPVEGLVNGDTVHIRVSAVDRVGLSSGYTTSKYIFDGVAPEINGFSVALAGDLSTLTWKGDGQEDIAGYHIYRSDNGAEFVLLGSRAATSAGEYLFNDTIRSQQNMTVTYKIMAVDALENASTQSLSVDYEYIYQNKPPVASILVPNYMMTNVEELFDASSSADDTAVVKYLWDFGDGTTSTEMKAVKKYATSGKYAVTLTVTDHAGLVATAKTEIEVKERESLGVLNVTVLDEKNDPVPYVPVYFDLGSDTQQIVHTNGNGIATLKLPGGSHLIGMYATGYLPVKKDVVVLENATRTVTLSTVQEEIVTGEFEITRMTFDEIVAAGIDVYDPANRNVYSATVRFFYGATPPISVNYVRNDTSILDYQIRDFNGNIINKYENENGESRSIAGVKYIGGNGGGSGGSENTDIIAILDVPAEASYLKEFFDVKLHIVNNAASDFVLSKNTVTLNVPEGMTLMDSVQGGYLTSPVAEVESIRGQETKTLAWVLRGDEAGEYDLSADFTGTLSLFNAPVHAHFETDTPIKVYGLEGVTFRVLAASEIYNEAFYFNIELENNRDIDIYAPAAGLTGKVKNVTESVLNENPIEDFYVESHLLNVYIEDENGARHYLPFTFDANNQAIVNVDVLAPGQKIVYEYVAYNAIDYDGIAYFKEAVVTEFKGLSQNIEVGSFVKEQYSFNDYSKKLDAVLYGGDSEVAQAYRHILNSKDFYYVTAANGKHIIDCENLYKTANVILNFDFSTLTQEEERDLIRAIVLTILSDSNVVGQSEDMLMMKYAEAVSGMIDNVKDGLISTFGSDESSIKDISDAIADILKDNRELAVVYRTEGADAFKAELTKKLGGYALGFSVDVADILTESDESACFGDVFGDVKDIVNVYFGAVEETARERHYYAALKKHCDSEISKTILYALRDALYNQLDEERNQAIMDKLLSVGSPITSLPDIGFGANMLAYQTVESMIFQLENDLDAYYEEMSFFLNVAEGVTEQVIQKTLQSVFSKAIGSTTFGIISAGFNIADAIFGIGDYVKQQDTFDVYNAMSNAMLQTHLESVKNRNPNADFYSMLYLRALCELRLSGEAQYKKFMNDIIDGVYFLPVDEDIVLFGINRVYDTQYTSFDQWGDDLQYSVVRPRDLIFNIESTHVKIPRAPVVSLNYDTFTTEQSFTDKYEYCFADGVWHPCDGGTIPFTVSSTPSVLRVREASDDDNLSGQITTVKIFAQKELSKLITAKFDGVKYILENLSSEYNYQILFIDHPDETLDWSQAKTIYGSQNILNGIAQKDYVVIRSCMNTAKGETISKPLTLAVSVKSPLNLTIDGNGKVTQSAATGCYFNGQPIDLIATPKENEEFEGWYVNGTFVSGEQHYIAEMADDLQITARFTGKKIVGVEIIGAPKKIVYYEGEDLDLNGLELAVLYGDETPVTYSLRTLRRAANTQEIAEQFTAYFVSNVAGTTNVMVRYGGHSVSYEIEIRHNTEEIVKDEPTCGQDGSKIYYCDLCKSIVRQESIPATEEHDYAWVTDKEPTCGEEGSKHQECTVCHGKTSLNTVVPATGEHSYEWVTDKEPTCGEEGSKHQECTVCHGKTSLDTVVPATGEHSYEWVTDKEPTCGEEGSKHQECTVCQGKTSLNTVVPATGEHSYEWVTDKEPTCGEEGSKHQECTVCQGKTSLNTVVPATEEHSYEWVTDKGPNGELTGTKHEECGICGSTRNENTFVYQAGDVDGTGVIDAVDALWVLQSAVGKRQLTSEELMAGDMNNDGKLDATDALAILKIAVGK